MAGAQRPSLAARGLVAVAPGADVQHTFGAGEPAPTTRTAELVQRTLDAFLIWQTATVELPVAVDTVTLETVGPDAGAFHLVSLGVDPS